MIRLFDYSIVGLLDCWIVGLLDDSTVRINYYTFLNIQKPAFALAFLVEHSIAYSTSQYQII